MSRPTPRKDLNLFSEYRNVWLFTLFDLPVETNENKRAYLHFRKFLLRQGFSMLQYSVYARFCASEESAEAFRRRLRIRLPDDGHVRLLSVTDRQFGKMEIFFGKKAREPEKEPEQLLLF
ncbi:MAG: CRISPR-associated endonuclease Cas2 [Rhodanobacteraceae bacterium]